MKKVLSLVLTIALTLSIIPTGLFSITANAQMTEEFAGGSGTAVDPYLIETKEQLNNVRNNLGAHYKLVADIFFEKEDFANDGNFYNNGHGFVPIGDSSDNAFTGTFDGNGFIIYNIYISNIDTDCAGLFGRSDGTIKNLGMVYSDIRETHSSTCYAGGIVACNHGAITNCYNTGKVMAYCSNGYLAISYVGGIAGINYGAIENCYNTGDIRADAGSYYRATVEVGGICGYNVLDVANCYNTGYVTGAAAIHPADHISSADTRKTTYAGGICGYNSRRLVNCYYLNNIQTGVGSDTDNTTKCTEEKLKLQSTFLGFDFENVWEFDETLKAYAFPVLKNAPHFEKENTVEFAGGYGTEKYPFLIATANNLTNVRHHMNAHYKLVCDIDLDGWTWTPIGDNTNIFKGVFDGDLHVINNLKTGGYNDYKGLFGYSTGTIQNLGIRNCHVSEDMVSTLYVGGIVGYNSGTVMNCYTTGSVFADAGAREGDINFANAGGIVGYNRGLVKKCYSTCSVTAYASPSSNSGSYSANSMAFAGGIVGDNNGTVTDCYNSGSIYASYLCSGLNVSYEAYAGGIAGRNFYSGKIFTAYNIGDVDSTRVFGGIAGYNNNSIYNCYYIDSAYMVAGGNSSSTSKKCTLWEMEQQSTYAGFDFETVWEIDGNGRYEAPTLQGVPMVGKSYVTDMEITAKPNKLIYLEGDAFDPAGMVVTLHYDDDREVCTADYTVSGYDSTPGTKTITVEYNNVSASFEVVVEELTHIEITTKPDKLIYLEGDKFDPTGMAVTAYSSSTNGLVLDYTVSGYDSTPGTKTIVVTYMNKTATFTVEVEKKSFVDFDITTKPSKLTYLEGDLFDPTGMIVTAYYNNETNTEVTDYTISGYDSTPGIKTITVEYNNVSKSFEVVVEAKSLTSIEITKTPTKTEYLEAKDELSVVGGQITLYYNNGTSQTIDMLPSMVSGFDNTIVGVQTLTVTHNEKTATYDIEIIKKTLVSIELIDNGLKKTYIEGQSLNVTGGQIRRYYNNDTYSDIALSRFYIGGFDNTTIGPQQLTVTYNGYSVYYDIEVIEKTLQSIAVSTFPRKTTYVDGQEFDATGMVVKANYDNGLSEIIKDYTLSGYDSAPGNKTIVVSYEGKTASFTVTVEEKRLAYISITTKPNKTEYLEGEPFDPTGMVVTAHYYNCEDEIITEYSISGYDSTPGFYLITITYKGKTTSFFVDVKSKSLTSISVTTKPNKTTYIESTALDDTGMVLTLYYNNNTSETITTGWVSEYDFSNVGTSVVEVTYGGKTCTYDVTVIAKTLTSIVVESEPNKLEYLEGDASLDTDGLVIRAYYNNDTSEIISGNYTVTGYNSTPGEKTITVTYQGKTATFTINVKAKSVNSISVTQKPNKLTYLEGDSFDKTGMVITAYYNNNTSSAVTDYAISGYTSTVGTKTITVSYGGKTATFTVTVNSRVPSEITSSKYTISGTNISKIGTGTTVTNLLKSLNEGSYCKVYKGSSVVNGDTAVGTGMTVKIMDGNTAKATYTIVVTGDTNGDGNITVTDMIAIKAHLLKKSTLSGVYAIAADTNGDNGISITDFIQVKAKILGKGTIAAR
ncbi:MAG: bacterial Ig-like domain-containing protein [Oscillospiraceae bacterium]|nr:bacterial Ig-like domain-containing protein [Oscillospiraceae bacterium]